MRDDAMECSEELLSGLLDDELDPVEKRCTALHAAACPHCAQALGQLFAMRAALSVPAPRRIAVPKTLWRGVREQLDRVDGLVRATNLAPRQRRPLVSPALVGTCLALLLVAFGAKSLLLPRRDLPGELTRLHLAASYGPNDPGLHQAVGFGTAEAWAPVSRSLISLNRVMVLQTTYDVGGLAVSVFRLPRGMLDTNRMYRDTVNGRTIYLAAFGPGSSMAAEECDGAWNVVVARTPPEDMPRLALTCPRAYLSPAGPY